MCGHCGIQAARHVWVNTAAQPPLTGQYPIQKRGAHGAVYNWWGQGASMGCLLPPPHRATLPRQEQCPQQPPNGLSASFTVGWASAPWWSGGGLGATRWLLWDVGPHD